MAVPCLFDFLNNVLQFLKTQLFNVKCSFNFFFLNLYYCFIFFKSDLSKITLEISHTSISHFLNDV